MRDTPTGIPIPGSRLNHLTAYMITNYRHNDKCIIKSQIYLNQWKNYQISILTFILINSQHFQYNYKVVKLIFALQFRWSSTSSSQHCNDSTTKLKTQRLLNERLQRNCIMYPVWTYYLDLALAAHQPHLKIAFRLSHVISSPLIAC